ncbi:MAG: HlyD family secretion protein [Lysobacterales bacterium]
MPRNRQLIITAVVLLAAWFTWSKLPSNGNSGETIETATVERGDISRSVATSGSVEALVMVEVGSQLSGQVKEIYVDFNDKVNKGQVIALIDPQTFQSRLSQAQADLKVAAANIEVRKASITRTEANLRKSSREYERQQPLAEQGTISLSELDSTQATFEANQAELEMERAQRRNAEASYEQKLAAVEATRVDFERTKIRSPIEGVVIERAVDVGQTVAASMSAPKLFLIAQDLSEIQIEANVDEADIGNVSTGNKVGFTVDAYPDRTFSGEVLQVRLAPNEEANVVTYAVIISAQNPSKSLLPGMTANVEIVTGNREDVLRLSNEAFRYRPPTDNDNPFAQPTQSGGGDGGRRGGGGDMAEQFNKNLEKLGVAQETIEAISADMRQEMSGIRSQMQSPDADRDAIRQQMSTIRDRVLARHLNSDQQRELSMLLAAAGRRANIWILDENGKPEAKAIRVGITDDRFTEIVTGLNEGDDVVTRIRKAAGS